MLKSFYESKDQIPQGAEGFYKEVNGKYELQAEGMKPESAFVDIQKSLKNEIAAHGKTKERVKAFGDLDPAVVVQRMDQFEELEARANSAGDPKKLEELAGARIKTATAPLQRELDKYKGELATATEQLNGFRAERTQRTIHDQVRQAATALKLRPEAIEDVLMISERLFEVNEDGKVGARDKVGLVPGLDPTGWLTDMQTKRPHWWPESQGGGAGGSGKGGNGGAGNPWSKAGWNMTAQGQYVRQHGEEAGRRMAESAGVALGATRPVK